MSTPSSPTTRTWWIIGSIGVTLGVALITWIGLRTSVGKVAVAVTGYHIIDASQAGVEYTVTRPPGTALRCTVKAQDVHHGVVGTGTDDVPAASEPSTNRTVSLRTTSLAVTVVVDSCVRRG